MRIHTGGSVWASVSSTAGWQAGSSQTLKENIKPLEKNDLISIRKTFENTTLYSYNRLDEDNLTEYGYIAENTTNIISPDGKSVNYLKTIGFISALIKDIYNQIDDLKDENKILKQELCKKDNSYSWC